MQSLIHQSLWRVSDPSRVPASRSFRLYALGISRSGFLCHSFLSMNPYCFVRGLFPPSHHRISPRLSTDFAFWLSITRCFSLGGHFFPIPTMTWCSNWQWPHQLLLSSHTISQIFSDRTHWEYAPSHQLQP